MVPRRSVVAVSAVGVQVEDPLEGYLFREGFREMVLRLEPTVVLSYAPLPAGCGELVEVVEYPTRWEWIRQARRQGQRRRLQLEEETRGR